MTENENAVSMDKPPTDPPPKKAAKPKPKKAAKPKKADPKETFVIGHDGKRVSSRKYHASDEHVRGYKPKED